MSSWPDDQLERIATGDDPYLSPVRTDETTYAAPTWIWSVRLDGELYVRAYNSPAHSVATTSSFGGGRLGLVSEQSRYNLTSRAIEAELVSALRHFGVGLVPYGPIGGGLLAGVLDQPREGRRATLREQVEQHRGQIEAYEDLCRELGKRPADVAVAWVLANPAVYAAIVGPCPADQLQASLRSPGITLDPVILARLDETWPGPGGEAPESYAW